MYPLVEFLTGVLFFGCYCAFGFTLEALKWAVFSALMIVLVFTDLRERILPDVVNYTGFALGLVAQSVHQPDRRHGAVALPITFSTSLLRLPVLSLADALLGAAVGSGLLWLVSEAYFRLRGREGMGWAT